METKETSLVWHYQNADPELGPLRAKELHDHLVGALADEPAASVAIGSQIVEVGPQVAIPSSLSIYHRNLSRFNLLRVCKKTKQGVTKGVAVRRVLSEMARRGVAAPDMVLCFGDGEADEAMFEALAWSGPRLAADARVFACTVGKKETQAVFYVEEPADVVDLLRAMARCYSF
jgi:trehalose 6-phosphate synthase/phosphatase